MQIDSKGVLASLPQQAHHRGADARGGAGDGNRSHTSAIEVVAEGTQISAEGAVQPSARQTGLLERVDVLTVLVLRVGGRPASHALESSGRELESAVLVNTRDHPFLIGHHIT